PVFIESTLSPLPCFPSFSSLQALRSCNQIFYVCPYDIVNPLYSSSLLFPYSSLPSLPSSSLPSLSLFQPPFSVLSLQASIVNPLYSASLLYPSSLRPPSLSLF
ncbi:hypothetical protein AMTR_s00433p00014590, partial [Amborella trichopoda]